LSTIVVGVDGSDESKRALRWAVEEAALRRADLKVVHAYEYKVPWHAFAAVEEGMNVEQMQLYQEGLQQEATEVRQQAEAFVEDVVREVDHEGVKVQTLALPDRHPADALVEQSEGADMLVVGSRGLGGFTGLVVGSVSQQCLHHAKCPVMVIRAST
jgi:nucleotide-binding universal stress UspA family protein